MTGALVEHAADVRGERHIGREMPRKNLLALVDAGGANAVPLRSADVAALDFAKRSICSVSATGKSSSISI